MAAQGQYAQPPQTYQPVNYFARNTCDDCSEAAFPPPFYDGPCPPPCRVPGCHPPCPGGRIDAYGFFVQTGALAVAAGGSIPFSSPGRNVFGLNQSGGDITLPTAGTYLVSFVLNVPANHTLGTTLSLRLNGAAVAGTSIAVDKTGVSAPVFAAAQSIVTAAAGSVLSVVTSASINLNSAANTLASLIVIRIA